VNLAYLYSGVAKMNILDGKAVCGAFPPVLSSEAIDAGDGSPTPPDESFGSVQQGDVPLRREDL